MSDVLTVGQIQTLANLTQTWGLAEASIIHIYPLVKGGVDNGAIVATFSNKTSYTIQKSGKVL